MIVAEGSIIDVGDLPGYIFDKRVKLSSGIPVEIDKELERLEREFITAALKESGGVQARAAERLGISERSLWHRIKKLEIRISRNVQ